MKLGLAKTRRVVLLCGGLWFAGTVLSCHKRANPKDTNMQVEIDVYSGRPNPVFVLSPAAGQQLASLLRDLPKSAHVAPEPGLGYRGFLIRDAAAGDGLKRIFGGWVLAGAGQETIVYTDIHGAEAWLKKQAVDAGYGALVR